MQTKILIVGGTGGIGSALARRLRGRGWDVAVAARDEAKLASLADELGVVPIRCNALVSTEVDAAFQQASEALGGLGAAANCVGSILIKPIHLTSDQEWAETLALNLTSAFHVLRAGARTLKRDGGSIVLCSSAAAQAGLANHEAIAAAKAGIIGMVRSAAATYAPMKLRVNAVAPGLTDTPMASRITQSPASLKVSLGMHALGRIGTPEDVASALAWLLDPEQSWVTGQVLGVEGGLTLK